MNEAGLADGRIGTDDLRLTQWMADMDLARIEPVDAINILREIRIVKTDDEIAIMRDGARMNETACLKAIDAMYEGATWPELTNVHATEMARQGGRARYMNTYLGGLPYEKIVRDEPLYFDALGEYKLYLADFGRSAVFGTPSSELESRVKGLRRAFKPRSKFSSPACARARSSTPLSRPFGTPGSRRFSTSRPTAWALSTPTTRCPWGRKRLATPTTSRWKKTW